MNFIFKKENFKRKLKPPINENKLKLDSAISEGAFL